MTTVLSLVASAFIICGFFLCGSLSRVESRRYFAILLGLIAAQFLIAVFLDAEAFAKTAALAVLVACAVGVDAMELVERVRGTRAWLARARDPLVLHPPFAGAWKVVAGGPVPAENHHQIASDQYFAYDFMRQRGASLGCAILAPLDGRVVATRDDMDDRRRSLRADHPSVRGAGALGNHVIIESERAYLFLCHLQKGSICVSPGQLVRIGDRLGACGNSGRTTAAHLHIHAQDEPAYAFNRANGIPVAFQQNGEPKVLRRSDVVSGR